MAKNLWLHQTWSDIYNNAPDAVENQLGAQGGGGAFHIKAMYDFGFQIPEESMMPYVPNESLYHSNPHYLTWPYPTGTKQRNVSDFNLDPNNLKASILHSPKFYGAGAWKFFTLESNKARDTDLIESILRDQQKVVWDYADWNRPSRAIWRPAYAGDPCAEYHVHSVLIVGFHRTDPDPSKHYFMIKNSWGSESWTNENDPDHLTYICYNSVRQLGIWLI